MSRKLRTIQDHANMRNFKTATHGKSATLESNNGKSTYGSLILLSRPSSIPKHARKGAKEVVVNNFHLKKMSSNLAGLFNEICGKDEEY